jgi:hypothetical protein
LGTEILLSPTTKLTLAARRMQPREPDAFPGSEQVNFSADLVHNSDDLVTRRHRQPRRRDFTLGQMQVGVAYATCQDAHSDLSGAGVRFGDFFES